MDVIERKINCSREFTRILIRRLGERLFRVVLFGSVAKGLGCG
jgi:predicted nucleotidyltransferase